VNRAAAAPVYPAGAAEAAARSTKMALKRGGAAEAVKEEATTDLTPMIDVTFQLLIFFMLTIKFKTLDGKFQTLLPLNSGLGIARAERDDFVAVLRVAEEDRALEPGRRRVRLTAVGRREPFGAWSPRASDAERNATTLAALRAVAKAVREASPRTAFKIDATADVPHAAAMAVIDVAYALEYPEISYAGIPAQALATLIAPTTPR
jgi:biopolymer transport protein ExbD